ncbi:MAG: hydrogenase maturation nickel metallochaperone HypA [Alphaproteobacteria bacterium]|nr:hydrogenase maturation nickel metallochaperone HypA [Alphaproteobacteria bacterium]MBF0394095.1 hydrogenase maturation nickel metallochaperone HypA [Alphaproteobacteria bacterium]
MHEMSLTEGVFRILDDQAASQGFARVKAVVLEIGELSQVDPESMRFCFEAIKGGTIAEGAVLEILRPPGRAFCMPCGVEVAVAQRYDACPHCGGHQLQVIGGEEMRVKEMEVE